MLGHLAMLLVVATAGCGDDDGGGPPAGPVALESFCAEYADAYCTAVAPCMCSADDAMMCRERAMRNCILGDATPFRIAVSEGRMVYDPDAAGAFLATLRGSGCDLRELTDGATPYDHASLFGVLEGGIAPGETCGLGSATSVGPDECRRGVCVGTTCLGFSVEGEPCDVDPEMRVVSRDCVPEVPVDEPLGNAALRCAPDAPGSMTGTCLLALPDGEACTAPADCRSGRCEGTCTAKAADGLPCTENLECTSGRCDFTTGRCRAPEPDEGLCTAHIDCASGYCDRDLKLGAGNCRPRLAVGGACEEDPGCLSGYCASGLCAEAVCGL